jgi:hypothetical protein
LEREKVNIEPTQMKVIDRNNVNFVPVDHIIMDSLYFDNIYQKMVFIQLKRFANWHTNEAFPSRATLAQLCFCGETKIKTTIKELEAKKLIEVKERFEDGKQLSNLYVILEYPFEMYDKHYKNKGGHDTPPTGSHNAPHGVTTRPPRGHDTPTKEIDLKEKDFKEKNIKNDDDVLRSHYFSTQEYFLLEQKLNDNGFTDKQIIAIKNKFASEKQSWQIKNIVIDMAIALYLEGKEKTKVGSIPAFFYYQFEKAFNDLKVNGKQRQLQYEKYLKQENNDTVPFYNWLEQ